MRIKSLPVLALFAFTSFANAQNYRISSAVRGQGSQYLNVSNLNEEVEGRYDRGQTKGWTPLAFPVQNTWTQKVPLPFAFRFAGQPVEFLRIHPYGVVSFKQSTQLDGINQTIPIPLESSLLPDSSFLFPGLKILKRPMDSSAILVKTFGEAPHRQFWIQFNVFRLPAEIESYYSLSIFSLVLEESTDRLYVNFQHHTAVTNLLKTFGIRVKPSKIFSTQIGTIRLTRSPEDNLIFRFDNSSPETDIGGLYRQNKPSFFVPKSQSNSQFTVNMVNYGKRLIDSVRLTVISNKGHYFRSPNLSGPDSLQECQILLKPNQKWFNDTGWVTLKYFPTDIYPSPDDDPSNDTLVERFYVYDPANISSSGLVKKKDLSEVISSTTCPNCPSVLAQWYSLTDSIQSQINTIKFMHYFPYGANYWTWENTNYLGGDGISGVPTLRLNGFHTGFTEINLIQINRNRPTFLEMKASGQLDTVTGLLQLKVVFKTGRTVPNRTFLPGLYGVSGCNESPVPHMITNFLTGENGIILPDFKPNSIDSLTFERFRNDSTWNNSNCNNNQNLEITWFVRSEMNREIFQSVRFTPTRTGGLTSSGEQVKKGTQSVFPNPCRHYLDVLESNTVPQRKEEPRVFQTSGREIKVPFINLQNGIRFDTRDLTPGVYFIRWEEKAIRFVKGSE